MANPISLFPVFTQPYGRKKRDEESQLFSKEPEKCEWEGRENKRKYDVNSICVPYVCFASKDEMKNMMKDCSRI